MDTIRELWMNKKQPQGRIDITLFFINLFLLICHIFLMVVYIVVDHKFMMCINAISLLIYSSQIFACFKNVQVYVPLTFFEIWFHMIFAILAFGWTPCFQNWTFALIAAYFLPTYSVENEKKSPLLSFMFSFVLIMTYFIISVLIHVINIPIASPLGDYMNRLLFTVNNLFSFFAIMMLALFYASTTKRKEYELTRKADYDELTDLYNRYAITQVSKRIIKDSKESKKSYSVAILDIDHFKKINDKYGHISGDDVLKELAKIFKFYSIKGLTPARWGGEEFMIIAPSNVSYREFLDIMEKIRVKISRVKFKVEDGEEINLTISIGAASSRRFKSFNDVIKAADKNLYDSKRTGRNKLIG